MKIKTLSITLLLIMSLLISSTVIASNDGHKDCREKMDKMIEEADKQVPGLKSQYEEIYNERVKLRNEIKEIFKKRNGNKKISFEDERKKFKEEIEKEITELRIKVDKGEITEQQLKDHINSKKEQFLNKWKNNNNKHNKHKKYKSEKMKKIREQREALYNDLKKSVEDKDIKKIKKNSDKIIDMEKEINNKYKTMLYKLNK